MATRSLNSIDPLQRLRRQVTEFEASLALVLARPKKSSVHAMRKSTRQIEAQLKSIDLGETTERLHKLLDKLRKAAGAVRDLDVQRDSLKELRETRKDPTTRREAKQLRAILKTHREEEAERLLEILDHHSLQLAPLLEKLLNEMSEAKPARLSPAQLAQQTQAWFSHQVPAIPDSPSTAQLHSIRKAAKLARYMSESAGGEAEQLAARFEKIQQSGGNWHDGLLLRKLARKHFGKRSPLVAIYKKREQSALTAFLREIAQT